VAINHYSQDLAKTLAPLIDIWSPSPPIAQTMQKDLKDKDLSILSDGIGFYTGVFFNTSPDRVRSLGWLAARGGYRHYSIFAYHQQFKPGREWVLFCEGGDGVLSTPALEALRDGFEDYLYLNTLKQYIDRTGKMPKDKKRGEALSAAEKLLDNIYKGKDGRLKVEEKPGGHGSSSYYQITDPDRWQLSDLHSEIIKAIDNLK